jgi:hypothetical protein
VLHKPADVVHIAAETIELGDDYVGPFFFGAVERLYQSGRLSSPPLSTSVTVSRKAKPLASANRLSASCWPSRPRPERPCFVVDTRIYPIARRMALSVWLKHVKCHVSEKRGGGFTTGPREVDARSPRKVEQPLGAGRFSLSPHAASARCRWDRQRSLLWASLWASENGIKLR